jgi:DNA-binding response OmpR family regulator
MNTQERILLVEDEPEIAAMLAMFFEQRGYTFLRADTGVQALAMGQQHMPHLILMDILLPDMDGFEVCSRLRSLPRTSHIPIIFLTRRDDKAARMQALELGADDFIAKPFDPAELLLRVRNSMARAEQQNLIDRRSGLPGALVVREYLARARTDPASAIIEITLENSSAYTRCYGAAAIGQVQGYLAQVVVWALDQSGVSESFAGYAAEDRLVVICPASQAQRMAERIATVFNFQVGRYYREDHRQDGALVVGGERYPLMKVTCRVHTVGGYAEVS